MMDASPAEALVAYLISQGAVTRPSSNGSWPATTTTMPDALPDNYVTITNPDAENQGKNPRSGENYLSPNCQIRVRSKPASAGYDKLREILALLSPIGKEGVGAVDVTANRPQGGTEVVTIVSVTLISGPAYIGQEEKNQRQHHVINVKTIVVPGV